MTSRRVSSWPVSRLGRASLVLALGAPLFAACATMHHASADFARSWQLHVSRPLRYRLAGVSFDVRMNLTRGQNELDSMNYREALASLNRAVWDIEGIQRRSLRLVELADVYDGLARAYAAVGRADVAEEHRQTAAALAAANERDPAPHPLAVLTQAKDAYSTARFREALTVFRAALVDLEDLSDRETRIQQLAQTRCYLAFTYFAGQDRERVRDELRRLAALDGTLSTCTADAPPGVRSVMAEVLRTQPSE